MQKVHLNKKEMRLELS